MQNEYPSLLGLFFGFAIKPALFVLVMIALFTSVKIVREKTAAIVEVFGKYSRVLHSGFNIVLPWPIAHVVERLDLRIQEIKKSIEVKTIDNMFVHLPVSIMYQVDEDQADQAYYQLQKPDQQIERWVLNTVRANVADIKLENLFTDRGVIAQAVEEELKAKIQKFGYHIHTVLIDQPMVSDEVQNSFNRVISSQRDREAATQEAEGARVRTVTQAIAEAEAQKERATGLAEARKIIAKSYAESIVLIKESGGDPTQAMEILLAVNRLDTLREIGKHENLIIADMNTGSALSSSQVLQSVLASKLQKAG
jgi:regulator of protease activity HflC (stomatin/prohibitin superfamily)